MKETMSVIWILGGDLVGFLVDFDRAVGRAVWLEHINRTGSWCGPCKTDLPPIYI